MDQNQEEDLSAKNQIRKILTDLLLGLILSH
jgi:hypothetical protein